MCPSPGSLPPTVELIQQLLKTFCESGLEEVQRQSQKPGNRWCFFGGNPVSHCFGMGHHLSEAQYLTFQFLCTPFLMCKQTVSVLAKDAYYKSIKIRLLMQIISPYICLICQFRFFRFPVKLCPAIEVVSRTASLVETDNWEDL